MNTYELSFRETQEAALNILKEIDRICRENQLTYWLAYGTLIGALRHKGFIPWDDDIDICMPRSDYEKLLAYFDDHASELLPLVSIRNTEAETLPFLITRISDTTYKMVGETGVCIPSMGAFIDIYPLDGLGNSYKNAKKIKRECFRQMFLYIHSGNFESNKYNISFLKVIAKKIVAFILKNPKYYEDKQKSILKQFDYSNSAYVSVAIWGRFNAMEVFRSECFSEKIPVEFEGLSTWAPAGYDEVLRGFYKDSWGEDYMKLPPENQRVPNHTYKLVYR